MLRSSGITNLADVANHGAQPVENQVSIRRSSQHLGLFHSIEVEYLHNNTVRAELMANLIHQTEERINNQTNNNGSSAPAA